MAIVQKKMNIERFIYEMLQIVSVSLTNVPFPVRGSLQKGEAYRKGTHLHRRDCLHVIARSASDVAICSERVQWHRLRQTAIFVVQVLHCPASEDRDRLRCLPVPVNREHRTRLQRVQHALRLILCGITQIHVHTQAWRSLRLFGEGIK